MNAEYIIPFFIPAPSGSPSVGLTRLDDPGTQGSQIDIELYVASGGPVFLFFGRRDKAEAYYATHPDQQATLSPADFDACANIYTPSRISEISMNSLTLTADASSIGFVKVIER